MNESYKRRGRLLINGKFQIRYISLILGFMFITVVVTGYTVYATTWIIFGEKLAAVYPQGLLLEIVKKVNAVLLLRMLFLTPLVAVIGLVLSHRIAGPIYSMKKFLKNVSDGDYSIRLRLRKKDEMKDVAEALNHLVEKLESERVKQRDKM
ncbi:MAG: methyl-accepting chemotaxis protein [Candidatus Omnitrophota bacterium]